MWFWIASIGLTAIAVLSVVMPFLRGPRAGGRTADHDLEVYRDQLAELERDAERGLIDPAEKEEARAEIARRILRTAGEGAQEAATSNAVGRRVAFASVLAVPLVAWGVYSLTGSPDLPGQPLAARLKDDPGEASLEELVARAERHLEASPEDGRGWDVLAPVYLRLGRYADSAAAYEKASRLLGASADREAGLGEALAAAAGGRITELARQAFERALAQEPGHPKAQFFLASALAQAGETEAAAMALARMRDGLPEGSPWASVVDQALAGLNAGSGGAPGPSDGDVAAAAGMDREERQAMIDGMVARLDRRLMENPRDLDGWRRLVRSYVVLGRVDDAADALSRGVAAFGETSDEARALEAFARTLGVTRTE